MRRTQFVLAAALAGAALGAYPGGAAGQGNFQIVTGKAFDSALPHDFYLEGNAIPTEKRNAVLLTSPKGSRVLIALIDTTGYSSQIQQKYEGMVITEGMITICEKKVAVGSYGFGLERPGAQSSEDAMFFLYDQAGKRLLECRSKKDANLNAPRPLRVVPGFRGTARLYLGRYWLELR